MAPAPVVAAAAAEKYEQQHDQDDLGHTLSPILRVVVSALVLYLVVAWLYRVGLPEQVRKSMPLWPGTLLVVVTVVVCALGYGAYLSVAGDGSVYLAGLAVTAITMTLLYLFAFALLLGLVVNLALARHETRSDAPGRRAAGGVRRTIGWRSAYRRSSSRVVRRIRGRAPTRIHHRALVGKPSG